MLPQFHSSPYLILVLCSFSGSSLLCTLYIRITQMLHPSIWVCFVLHSTPLHISFSTCVCFSTTITQTCTHLSVSGRHVPPNIIPHIALYAPLISPPQQCIQQKFQQEGKINMSFWWPGFHTVVNLFSKNTTAPSPFSLGTRKSLPVHSKAVNLKSGSPGMLSVHFLSCAQVFCPSADPLLQPLQHWRQMFLSSILGLKAMIGGFSLWAKAPSPGSQCTSGASMNSKVLLSSFSPLSSSSPLSSFSSSPAIWWILSAATSWMTPWARPALALHMNCMEESTILYNPCEEAHCPVIIYILQDEL